MLEKKVLNVIINEIGNIGIRKDKHYYRLYLFLNCNKFSNVYLEEFCLNVTNTFHEHYFRYDKKNNRYYVYGNRCIELLEVIEDSNMDYFLGSTFNKNLFTVLANKDLFTRKSGKKYNEYELARLHKLYLMFKEVAYTNELDKTILNTFPTEGIYTLEELVEDWDINSEQEEKDIIKSIKKLIKLNKLKVENNLISKVDEVDELDKTI